MGAGDVRLPRPGFGSRKNESRIMIPIRVRNTLIGGIFAGLFTLIATAPAVAQSGKLSGQVVDEQGEPLIGTTVLIVGTQQGAATDVNGQYAVINIPPGTYSVRYSMIGFSTQIVEGIRIQSNQTTEQNVTLTEEVIEGEEVIVTAERPIVDVSLTSSMATVSREEIAVLPVQRLEDIVNLQAGVIDGHFRGGRSGEVQYQVDGVSVNNPFDNAPTLSLDRSVLQEVQVISGTFDAEYGQAMSGVVNAVLRAGQTDQYEFQVETFFGDYFSTAEDRFPHIGDMSPTVLQNFQATMSGPVPLVPNTTFLFNGQRFENEGYMYGERVFLPTDSVNFETGYLDPTGDLELVPLGFDNRWNWLGKLSNRSIPGIKLEYQGVGNVIERKFYSHPFRLNPDGTKTNRQFSIVHGLDVTHTVRDDLYYTISLRHNYFDFEDLRYEDVQDPRYLEAGPPRSLQSIEDGAILTGLDLGRFIQRTNAGVSKGSVTYQATKVHLLKAGYEFQFSKLEFGPPGILTNVTRDGVEQLLPRTDTLNARVLEYNPVQGAAFFQDRVEWRDIRVRAGIRAEYFDAKSTIPSDLANPANSITGAPESRAQPTSVKLRVAPRLGVSFPILNQASMFFSFGHFYQMPGLGEFFANADYSVLEDLQAGTEDDVGVLGNPDLKPEFTAQYEFGFKAQLTSFLGLDLSLFHKDIRDLLGVEFIQTYTAARYARFTNVDFGQVRGFTIQFDQRGAGPISTSLDYTLQIASGNSSDPKETFNRSAAGEDPLPRQVPFNWDQRHTLNATATWYERDNFAITGIAKLGSGQPFTPAISSVFGSELQPNSGRKDAFLIVDVRAEKFINVFGVQWTAFARVFNLLDEHFANGFVFASTGSPFYTLTPESQRAQLTNPGRFFAPRRIEVGISFRGVIPR